MWLVEFGGLRGNRRLNDTTITELSELYTCLYAMMPFLKSLVITDYFLMITPRLAQHIKITQHVKMTEITKLYNAQSKNIFYYAYFSI